MTNDIVTNFYNNVKFLCKEKALSLADIEREIRVSPGYLSRVVGGRKDLGVVKAYHIAEVLDTPLTDLLETELWKKYRIRELKAELEALEGEQNDFNRTY